MPHVRSHDTDLTDAPMDPGWVRSGDPRPSVRQWAQSADGTVGAYVWACTAGTFDWHFSVDEHVTVVDGAVTVTSPEGERTTLEVGDSAFFPAGTVWLWEVPTSVRKHAVLSLPLSRGQRVARNVEDRVRPLVARARGRSSAAALTL